MGLSAPGVGIHGTPDAASIGYSASHGCIRMRIPDAETVFAHVDVGTPVFIVAA
jgi:lipoprotein-anchoring transpeptidase ErfK/SrfK